MDEQTNATAQAEPQMTQAQVLTVLKQAQANLQEFIDSLSDEERAAIGEATFWSAKDNLAHMAYWALRVHEVFEDIRAGKEPPSPGEEFQPINERVFVEWHERPWDEVVSTLQRAYAELADDVTATAEEELCDPNRFPSRKGEALGASVIGTAAMHASEHYSQYYLEHGRSDLAVAIEERNLATTRDIFGASSEVYGDMLYNVGCYYAKNGQPEEAIDAVRQAFPLHPWLIEWSKQDSDLDSIRELPAFQALYG